MEQLTIAIGCVDPALSKQEIPGIQAKVASDGTRYAGHVQLADGITGTPILLDGDSLLQLGEVAEEDGRRFGYINDDEAGVSVYGSVMQGNAQLWMRAAGGIAFLHPCLKPVAITNHLEGDTITHRKRVPEELEAQDELREAMKMTFISLASRLLNELGFKPERETALSVIAEGHTNCAMERINTREGGGFGPNYIAEAITQKNHAVGAMNPFLQMVARILGPISIEYKSATFELNQEKTLDVGSGSVPIKFPDRNILPIWQVS